MNQKGDNKSNIIHNNDSSDILELYKIMRDYITHEDFLIHNRLTWLLTIQGLLFTAYVLALRETTKSSDLVSLIVLLKILGIATSVLGFAGILAAALAVSAVKCKWQSIKSYDLMANSLADKLPDVTGGGSLFVHILGVITPLSIPFVFFCAWLKLLKPWIYILGLNTS